LNDPERWRSLELEDEGQTRQPEVLPVHLDHRRAADVGADEPVRVGDPLRREGDGHGRCPRASVRGEV
jgi:hypothetical protein